MKKKKSIKHFVAFNIIELTLKPKKKFLSRVLVERIEGYQNALIRLYVTQNQITEVTAKQT
jgi:hypothetical protein